MNYLRKKLQAIMAGADFKGYLREVTGTDSVTLTDCMGSDMTSLSLVGNAVQDGTPNPETPVEVQGVGEKTGNLFDISGSIAISGGTIAVEGTKITFTTTDNCYGVTLAQNIQLKPNTAYTVSYRSVTFDGSYGGSYGLRVNCDGIWGSMEYGKTYCNFTTGDVGVVTINYYVGMPYQGEIGKLLVLEEPMLVKGSYTAETMPPYEPYGYKVPVEVSGINLFNVSQITDTSYITRDGDKLILNDYACASQLSPEDFLEMTGLQPGDTITTTRDVSVSKGVANSITGRISFFNKSGGAGYVLTESSALRTSVIPDDFDSEHYTSAYFYGALTPDENGDRIAEMSNIMILKGTYTADTMPPYEPYHAPQTFNVYMDKPLYGLKLDPTSTGYYTYMDADGNKYLGDTITIDFDNRTATRTDNVTYASLASCRLINYSNWGTSNGLYSYHFQCSPEIKTTYDEDGTKKHWGATSMLCSHLPIARNPATMAICTGKNPGEWANMMRVWLPVNEVDSMEGDTASAKANAWWTANAQDYMALYITEPTTTDISALQDWDAMPKMWRGTVVISADTTIQPSSMTAQYYAAKKED